MSNTECTNVARITPAEYMISISEYSASEQDWKTGHHIEIRRSTRGPLVRKRLQARYLLGKQFGRTLWKNPDVCSF